MTKIAFDFDKLGVFTPVFALFSIIASIIILVIQIIFAVAVYSDAKRLQVQRSGLFLVGPFLWSLVTFGFSLAGLAVYWAVHHSTLRNPIPPEARMP